MKILTILVISVFVIIALVWLGLQIKPASFASFPQEPSAVETIPLPDGLPAPVERYLRLI